ncbi:hypothetical protein ABH932_006622 [Streptacidiphilus sp. MAP5-52]
MPVGSRTLATAASAALLTVGIAAALPAAANAAAPVGPTLPIALSVSADAPSKALQPGGPTETVTIKAANTTAKTADINLEDVSIWSGPLALKPGSLSLKATSEGATPASAYSPSQGAPDFGLDATVFPKGHPNGAFTIPAHTTFEWQVSVGVSKNWPANDGTVDLWVTFEEQGKTLHGHGNYGTQLNVGKGTTGGPVLLSLAGGTKVAPGHPAWEKVTVTNQSGAAIAEPLRVTPDAFAFGPVNQVDLGLYDWVGAHGNVKAHWQDVTHSGLVVAGGLANNASASTWVQLRVVSYKANAASEAGALLVSSPDLMPTTQDQARESLTVLR